MVALESFPQAGVELNVANALAEPGAKRGLALALSGGGYRAALFHLGALRRLNELGIFSQVDAVSCVSGGSILGAHLVSRIDGWPAEGEVLEDWEATVAKPFRDFARTDIRTPSLILGLLDPTGNAAKHLARRYDAHITRGRKLRDIPQKPAFVFCASDLSFGVAWYYGRDQVGDYQVGMMPTPPDLPLAEAVAASSCFPPVYAPHNPRITPEMVRGGKARKREDFDKLVRGLRLTDGGLYDNMGLEPVWKDSLMLLASDGGAPFKYRPAGGFFRTPLRYVAIADNQSRSLRKRWLIRKFGRGDPAGTYWGIRSSVSAYDKALPGYSEGFVDAYVERIRTDMDGFTEAEIQVLENHGYLLANAAVRRWVPKLVVRDVPAVAPHPSAMDEREMAPKLRKSHRRFFRWLF